MENIDIDQDNKSNTAERQNQGQQQGNSQPFKSNKEESGDRNPNVVETAQAPGPDEETTEATSWRSDDSFSKASKQKPFTGEESDLEDKGAGGF